MPHRPFRFVHASDFHLERPVAGLAEIPDHLRERLMEAPYAAAARVFDAVLAEEAEFLVLSGDILNPQTTGLRGPLFLVEQFNRLAARNTSVYWAGGEVDPPENWPPTFSLPENVHVFPRGKPTEFTHQRDGTPLARLTGQSEDAARSSLRPQDFGADSTGLFSIAVAHGNLEPAALRTQGIHYWALGGRHERATTTSSPAVILYPGTCQGRRPEETGTHGGTLVDVDEKGQVRTSLLPTDALRWLAERLTVDETTTRETLEGLLRERLRALIETTPKMDLLIAWTLSGSGPLLAQARRGGLAAELLDCLRSEFGLAQPAAWSVSLEVESVVAFPPAWFEQDSIRGDFLRAVRQLEMNAGEPLELESFLAEALQTGALASAATPDLAVRQRVLREAALLGVDLLSGEEST